MRDDDDTAGEGVDSVSQGINGGDVQAVGRLVEEQHVGSVDGEQGEDDSALLALGQRAHQRSLGVAGQAVLAELLAPVLVVLALLGVLVTDEVQSRLGQVELLGRVLGVDAHLQMGVSRHDTSGRVELAGHEAQERRFPDTVGADEGGSRVHVDTEIEVLVQVVLGLAAVGEGDIVKGQNWGWELLDIGEAESEDAVIVDLLDESIGLHLVQDLLSGLGLSDQVGVGTGRGDELLDVDNFFLLLVVGLHLVGLLLATGLRVGIVVTTIVDESLLSHINHVSADTVEEIHAVGDKNQCAVPLLEVFLEPHAGFQIQMCSGVIEEKERRLDEEGLGKGHSHTPSTRHVLGLLLDSHLVESETGQDEGCAGGECRRIHGLHTLFTWLAVIYSQSGWVATNLVEIHQ